MFSYLRFRSKGLSDEEWKVSGRKEDCDVPDGDSWNWRTKNEILFFCIKKH